MKINFISHRKHQETTSPQHDTGALLPVPKISLEANFDGCLIVKLVFNTKLFQMSNKVLSS